MSHAMACDQCKGVLRLDGHGSDPNGEIVGWVGMNLAQNQFHFCTLTCAQSFLKRDDVRGMVEGNLEAVSKIARIIRGEES